MHRPTADHRGFTLVELLVVIVIIGMLMAMLLPAVNAVREAGRRSVCGSNLHSQALAMVRFNDSRRFIPGWRNTLVWFNPNTNAGGTNVVSWPIMILPNIERSDVYKIWTTTATGTSVYISTLVCPSNPPDSLVDPWLHYAGNVGSGSNAVGFRSAGVMVDTTGTITSSPTYARVSMDDVAGNDGTATTLMLTERSGTAVGNSMWHLNANGSPTLPASFTFGSGSTSIPAFGIVGTLLPSSFKIVNNGTSSSPGFASQPSSNHPGGAVVAFCDGHTGYLKDTLPRHVYAQLLSWNHAAASGGNALVPTIAPYSTWIKDPSGNVYAVLQEADYQ